jgi:hypothetical protein
MFKQPDRSLNRLRFGLPLLAVLLSNLLLSAAFFEPVLAADPSFPDPAFQKVWNRTDKPIADGVVSRTWLWGPNIIAATVEPYAESPGGLRLVLYFDKTRMEITYPDGDQSSPYYVTNGLLAKELMSGDLQTGDNSFQSRGAAQVGVAGDPDDSQGPTYATLGKLLSPVQAANKTSISDTVDRSGNVGNDPALANYKVNATHFIADTGHNLADPFWDFLNSTGTVYNDQNRPQNAPLFSPTFYATGFPVTEPYWAKVKVAGQVKDVLVQGFERRVLTYTPGNDPAYRVEMGNVGQHYLRWRYPNGVPPAPPRPQTTLMRDFIGVNQNYKLYEDGTEADFARVSKWLRDYVRMYCIEPSENNYAGVNGSGGCGSNPYYFNYDAFYTNMQRVGVNVLHDTHWSSGFANWTGKDDDVPPVPRYGAGQRPDDFLKHAQHLYQLAALYGSNSGLPAPSLITPDKQAGRNLIQAIENWNEPNGWWKGDGQFTKEQFYNMLVADYDGDKGRLPNAGIKRADPNMKVVMGGLADSTLYYPYGILAYANRDGREFPADVINIHEYATDGKQGIPPEQANLRQHMERVVKWRNAYAPGRQVWITEFGWDTYRQGNQFSQTWATLQNQANWILRAYVLYRAAGADKAFAFIYNDPNPDSLTLYDSSGLVSFDNSTKKPSYYYVATMQDLIGNLALDRQLATGRDDVYNFAFKNPSGKSGVFVVWKTSGNGSTVSDFSLQLPANVSGTCTANVPSGNGFDPTRTTLNVSGNHQVKLTVSETPTFIQCNDVTGSAQVVPADQVFNSGIAPDGRITLGPDDVIDMAPTDRDPSIDVPHVPSLLDEQGGQGNPPTNTPATNWYALKDSDSFAIDLHNSYNLSQLSWFNAGGDGGSFDVFYADSGGFGNWKPLTTITNTGDNYNKWQSASLSTKAQFLYFVPKRGTQAKLGEIVVYASR